MKVELSDEQWDALTTGSFKGPDGMRYQQSSTRMRRRQVDDLLAAGSPLGLFRFGGGNLDRFQGQDADTAWKSARHRLTTAVPRPDGDVVWTAGEWISDDGSVVLLTGSC